MAIDLTVLIVDDSRIMRNTVKGMFSDMQTKCIFIEAGNGEEALEQMSMCPVGLVLLDWNMPKLSGIDFLKKVRAIETYKSLPIVMITSESAKYNVIEALKNGATDYLTKPVNSQIFKEKLSKILNK
ncbi:MAG: response regulator [Treponema sp.]|nr:response regulator [Treponema sp.]